MRVAAALSIVVVAIAATASAGEGRHGPDFGDVLQAIVTGGDIGLVRDSGKPVTRAFLNGCRKDVGPNHVVLESADLTSLWHISRVSNAGERYLFLISEEGASVENRWILEYQGGWFRDVTAAVWPDISIATPSPNE